MWEKLVFKPIRQMPLWGWMLWTILVMITIWFHCRNYLKNVKSTKKYGARTYIRESRRELLLSVLAFYMMYVFSIAVLARERTPELHYHLIPFWSWFRAVEEVQKYNIWGMPLQILYNVIVFVPIGLLSHFICNVRARGAFIYGFCFSAMIEISQLIFQIGDFEWDDMIHNALGCVLGAWIAWKIHGQNGQ